MTEGRKEGREEVGVDQIEEFNVGMRQSLVTGESFEKWILEHDVIVRSYHFKGDSCAMNGAEPSSF